MYNKLQLTNMLRSEVEHVSDSCFPITAFPDKIQEIILNIARYENFNMEYLASLILSAIATAVGNSCQIRIKGEWKTSPMLYMILIGRPGLGKTPPLGYIYSPINERDDEMFEKYVKEWDSYQQTLASSKKKHSDDEETEHIKQPHLVTTVISDFTPEAMLSIHQDNPRGIVLMVDEILSMFNSVKRYNAKNNLIEDLLSAYSGQPLKIIRKTQLRPILIKKPCINVIGSIQTDVLDEIFCPEFMANGLLDRFLFVFPLNKKLSLWKKTKEQVELPDLKDQWRVIIKKIFSIPCRVDKETNMIDPLILPMTEEAESYFYDWYNDIINKVNSIENDEDVESRMLKLNGHVARLALLFQIMKWATEDEELSFVTLDSVKSAIQMLDYYEDTYRRIQKEMVTGINGDGDGAFLSLLGNHFTTGEAVAAGRKLSFCKRKVHDLLKQMRNFQNPPIKKLSHGHYCKTAVENSNASCTIALSAEMQDDQASQSAKVQSANNKELINDGGIQIPSPKIPIWE